MIRRTTKIITIINTMFVIIFLFKICICSFFLNGCGAGIKRSLLKVIQAKGYREFVFR
jgi:hypothetical protein